MARFTIRNGELTKTVLTEDATFLEIPNNVTFIADFGLDISSNTNKYNESVTRIILPSSITSCSLKAFKGFVNLKEIEIAKDSNCFCVTDNMLLSKDKTIIYLASKDITGVVDIKWDFKIRIADYAFEYCKRITQINAGVYVNCFGDYCFSHCENLIKIDISHALDDKDLGVGMFSDCYQLKVLWIPHNITSIPESFAENCNSLEYVRLLDDNKLKKISKNAFANCKDLVHFSCDKVDYPNFVIKDTLMAIQENAFSNCKSLSEVTLYSERIDIANNAFNGCDNACFFCNENSDVEKFLIKKNYRYYHIEE